MKYKSNKQSPIFKKKRTGPIVALIVGIIAIIASAGALYYFIWRPIAPVKAPDPVAHPEGPIESEQQPLQEEIAIQPVEEAQPTEKITTTVTENGHEISEYYRQAEISFATPQTAGWKGISTFRGNEYRLSPTYGAAYIEEEKLTLLWEESTGSIPDFAKESIVTGQPLIVEWETEIWQQMPILPEKKEKEEVVEVIYPTMSGMIYFIDMEDGEPAREPIDVGAAITGTATLDPRGYPMLYVGSKAPEGESGAYMRVFNLLDGTELCRLSGQSESEKEAAFVSAPIVAGEADTLIWMAEDATLYTIKLNTQYQDGVLSVDPVSTLRYTYQIDGKSSSLSASPVVFRNYLFFADKEGWLQCVDLNTMKLIYAVHLKDSVAGSLVLEEDAENNTFYLYAATEVLNQEREIETLGYSYIQKIDGRTGELLWEKKVDCLYNAKDPGGTQAAPLLGSNGLEGLLFVTVNQTNEGEDSTLIALSTADGEERWSVALAPGTKSAPIPIYNDQGKGYLIQCEGDGTISLIEGSSGEKKDEVKVKGEISASPAGMYHTAVIQTNGGKVYAVRVE